MTSSDVTHELRHQRVGAVPCLGAITFAIAMPALSTATSEQDSTSARLPFTLSLTWVSLNEAWTWLKRVVRG